MVDDVGPLLTDNASEQPRRNGAHTVEIAWRNGAGPTNWYGLRGRCRQLAAAGSRSADTNCGRGGLTSVAATTRRAKHRFCHSEVLLDVQLFGKNNFIYVIRNMWSRWRHPASTRGTFGHSSPDVRRAAMDAVAAQDVRHNRVRSSRVVLISRCWNQAAQAIAAATGARKPGTPGRARSKP